MPLGESIGRLWVEVALLKQASSCVAQHPCFLLASLHNLRWAEGVRIAFAMVARPLSPKPLKVRLLLMIHGTIQPRELFEIWRALGVFVLVARNKGPPTATAASSLLTASVLYSRSLSLVISFFCHGVGAEDLAESLIQLLPM